MKTIDDDLDDGNAEFEDKSFVVSSTSWGESGIEDDYRALKKYKELLESLSNAGTVCAYLLIFALCTLSVWIVYSTDFEKVIFYDGSEATCILDSKTGVITNVQ